MTTENESMISPEIEGLLERSAEEGKEGSKFRLVTLRGQTCPTNQCIHVSAR